jgi:hypothetical protein
LSRLENGLSFGFKNLGIALLISACISTLAYVFEGFYCDGASCQQMFIANSILIDCIILAVWGITLMLKKAKGRREDILDV